MPLAINKKQLTAVEEINKHKATVNKSLEVFSNAFQDVDKVQDSLKQVIANLEDGISTFQYALKKAREEYEYNERIKEQLGQFRPDKINATDDEATK